MFKASRFVPALIGATTAERYADLKLMQADRCPKALGNLVKTAEVQFHHEVTNQYLWSKF